MTLSTFALTLYNVFMKTKRFVIKGLGITSIMLVTSGALAQSPHVNQTSNIHIESREELQHHWCGRCQIEVSRVWRDVGIAKDKKFACTFVVDKNRMVEDIKIEQSSGSQDVDQLLIDTLKKAAPFRRNAESVLGTTLLLKFDDSNPPKFFVSLIRDPLTNKTHKSIN